MRWSMPIALGQVITGHIKRISIWLTIKVIWICSGPSLEITSQTAMQVRPTLAQCRHCRPDVGPTLDQLVLLPELENLQAQWWLSQWLVFIEDQLLNGSWSIKVAKLHVTILGLVWNYTFDFVTPFVNSCRMDTMRHTKFHEMYSWCCCAVFCCSKYISCQ